MGQRKKSGTINPPAEAVELQPENTKNSVEGAEVQPADRNELGKLELEPKTETNSGFVYVSRKGKQTDGRGVRQSARVQGRVMPAHNQHIERVLQEITLSGSKEEEEEKLPACEQTEQQGPTMGNKKSEEKIDYLVQLLEELQDRSSSSGSLCQSRSGYKRLYISCQKKIEALTEENHKLALRLENALGKLEVYEKRTRASLEVLDKVKDVLLFSNISNINMPDDREASNSSPKRKKLEKREEK